MFQDSVPAGSYNDPFLSSVCDKVVCERLRVTKLCVKELCVRKLCVTKMCVREKLHVREMCVCVWTI